MQLYIYLYPSYILAAGHISAYGGNSRRQQQGESKQRNNRKSGMYAVAIKTDPYSELWGISIQVLAWKDWGKISHLNTKGSKGGRRETKRGCLRSQQSQWVTLWSDLLYNDVTYFRQHPHLHETGSSSTVTQWECIISCGTSVSSESNDLINKILELPSNEKFGIL